MTDAPRLTDRKRDAILAAAIAEFRANGFEATSMDRIATRAEVSKRTVYNHFPSKEVLFADILVQLWNVSASERELAYRSDVPLRDQLRELLAAKLRMLNDTHLLDLARVAIAAAIHSPERAQNMVARLGEKEEGLLVWLRAAQDDGKLRGKYRIGAQDLRLLAAGHDGRGAPVGGTAGAHRCGDDRYVPGQV
jgi:TetR/AcrR family transcriptional regulator of autoinduction and epiphytic fitness